jgi:hypothetical protein
LIIVSASASRLDVTPFFLGLALMINTFMVFSALRYHLQLFCLGSCSRVLYLSLAYLLLDNVQVSCGG